MDPAENEQAGARTGPQAARRTLAAEGVEPIPETLWERLRAQPERAPEALALAAAERFAPAAERWAHSLSPHHDPAEMASIALKKHKRLSTLEGAALGLGGAVTAAADVMALVWIQSRMVFYIAAAYGFDPAHPMRPAELLALQGVYETPAVAREALDGDGDLLAARLVGAKFDSQGDDSLTKKLLALAGRRLARRAALRLVPVVASPINAVGNRRATSELGQRALRYYGG